MNSLRAVRYTNENPGTVEYRREEDGKIIDNITRVTAMGGQGNVYNVDPDSDAFVVIDTTAGPVLVILPPLGQPANSQKFCFIRVGANNVTIQASQPLVETINEVIPGRPYQLLYHGDCMDVRKGLTVMPNGTGVLSWYTCKVMEG